MSNRRSYLYEARKDKNGDFVCQFCQVLEEPQEKDVREECSESMNYSSLYDCFSGENVFEQTYFKNCKEGNVEYVEQLKKQFEQMRESAKLQMNDVINAKYF